MAEEKIQLYALHFFEEGNAFFGEKLKDAPANLRLRYRIVPLKQETEKKDGETVVTRQACLDAACWRQDLSYEKAQDKLERQFPLTEEGRAQLLDWLQQQYDQLPEPHEVEEYTGQ